MQSSSTNAERWAEWFQVFVRDDTESSVRSFTTSSATSGSRRVEDSPNATGVEVAPTRSLPSLFGDPVVFPDEAPTRSLTRSFSGTTLAGYSANAASGASGTLSSSVMDLATLSDASAGEDDDLPLLRDDQTPDPLPRLTPSPSAGPDRQLLVPIATSPTHGGPRPGVLTWPRGPSSIWWNLSRESDPSGRGPRGAGDNAPPRTPRRRDCSPPLMARSGPAPHGAHQRPLARVQRAISEDSSVSTVHIPMPLDVSSRVARATLDHTFSNVGRDGPLRCRSPSPYTPPRQNGPTSPPWCQAAWFRDRFPRAPRPFLAPATRRPASTPADTPPAPTTTTSTRSPSAAAAPARDGSPPAGPPPRRPLMRPPVVVIPLSAPGTAPDTPTPLAAWGMRLVNPATWAISPAAPLTVTEVVSCQRAGAATRGTAPLQPADLAAAIQAAVDKQDRARGPGRFPGVAQSCLVVTFNGNAARFSSPCCLVTGARFVAALARHRPGDSAQSARRPRCREALAPWPQTSRRWWRRPA